MKRYAHRFVTRDAKMIEDEKVFLMRACVRSKYHSDDAENFLLMQKPQCACASRKNFFFVNMRCTIDHNFILSPHDMLSFVCTSLTINTTLHFLPIHSYGSKKEEEGDQEEGRQEVDEKGEGDQEEEEQQEEEISCDTCH